MMLANLLRGVTVRKFFQQAYGQMVVTQDLNIHSIQYDSRKVSKGDLFVAIRGSSADGHRFIGDAVSRGAAAVMVDDDAAMHDSYLMHQGVAKILVPDTRAALALVSARMYGDPAGALTMIGVTGTNGKTTTTYLVRSILDQSGTKTGLIGTIAYNTGSGMQTATHTTPESLELQQLLAAMKGSGCTAAVMEVSSHALHQHRVDGIGFRVAAFTNLTQDHLDYHGTMDAYFGAKRLLFEGLSPDAAAVINADDPYAKSLAAATKARVMTYGIDSDADIRARHVDLSLGGTRMTVQYQGSEIPVESPLIGRFNVSNLLAAYGIGLALGIPGERLRDAIRSAPAVPGRFQQFQGPAGWTAIIDYAHTPDALEKVLRAIHDVAGTKRNGRIITVFGCGGNRDRTKRPKMGAIAAALSDLTIVTSDNPRREDPLAIIGEVMAGIPAGAAHERIPDRAEAIRRALSAAGPGDAVLIAGKGHEEYQVVGDEKIPYSDTDVVTSFIGGSRR